MALRTLICAMIASFGLAAFDILEKMKLVGDSNKVTFNFYTVCLILSLLKIAN